MMEYTGKDLVYNDIDKSKYDQDIVETIESVKSSWYNLVFIFVDRACNENYMGEGFITNIVEALPLWIWNETQTAKNFVCENSKKDAYMFNDYTFHLLNFLVYHYAEDRYPELADEILNVDVDGF